jgi:ferredoxin-nitrate reductase
MRPNESICPYCGVGCRVQATVEGDQVVRVGAEEESQPNFGMLCPKGGLLSKVHALPGRLTVPQIRESLDEPFREVSWETALAYVADRLTGVRERYGKQSAAFYGSGQLDTEASYLAVKLFKGAFGTNHMDTNSRLCMSSAVAGYLTSLGSDGPPPCYDDIEKAETFFILGANMADNHPILFNRVIARRRSQPDARIICVDPRRTKTAQQSDVHLAVAPDGDLALLNALAQLILESERYDRRFILHHTNGFEELAVFLRAQSLREMSRSCGIEVPQLREVAELLLSSKGMLSLYCQGANQSVNGTAKNNAIINLHLLLGQIGREGAGPFSLTGQPNAMGGRECGYLCHQLPGYRFVENEAHRAEVERLWNLPEGSVYPTKGYSAVPMFEAMNRGEIRALFVAATNPAASMPHLNRVQSGLENLDLCILQDCFEDSETARYAHVLLPAAQWGEKTGTSTNSERLVTRSPQKVRAPGQARPDWWILAQIGRAMGFSGFDYRDNEDVWNEYRRLTQGTPCDQWGMTNERLQVTALHWPCPNENHPGTSRLYTQRRFPTSDGHARFWVRPHRPAPDAPDEEFPLILTTGRIATQWHTRTRTGKIPELNNKSPEPFVEVHPVDAERHHIQNGEWVSIRSRRGDARAKAVVTENIRQGVLFAPFHWGDAFAPDTAVNDLTSPEVDPVSGQPALKYCAVRLEKIDRAISAELQSLLGAPLSV